MQLRTAVRPVVLLSASLSFLSCQQQKVESRDEKDSLHFTENLDLFVRGASIICKNHRLPARTFFNFRKTLIKNVLIDITCGGFLNIQVSLQLKEAAKGNGATKTFLAKT